MRRLWSKLVKKNFKTFELTKLNSVLNYNYFVRNNIHKIIKTFTRKYLSYLNNYNLIELDKY